MKASDSRKAIMKLCERLLEQLAPPRGLDAVFRGHPLLGDGAVGFPEGLRQGLGGEQVRDDGDRALLGVALDLAGAHALPEVRDIGELDQGAARARHREGGQDGGVASVLRLEAQPDVVLLAAFPVESHLLATDHRPERGRDGVHPHAEVRGFAAVDVHLDLRLPESLRGVDVDEAALGLEGLDHPARVLLEPGRGPGPARSG